MLADAQDRNNLLENHRGCTASGFLSQHNTMEHIYTQFVTGPASADAHVVRRGSGADRAGQAKGKSDRRGAIGRFVGPRTDVWDADGPQREAPGIVIQQGSVIVSGYRFRS